MQTLATSRTLQALRPGCTDHALYTLRTRGAGNTLRTLDTSSSWQALCPGDALHTLCAGRARQTLDALRTRCTHRGDGHVQAGHVSRLIVFFGVERVRPAGGERDAVVAGRIRDPALHQAGDVYRDEDSAGAGLHRNHGGTDTWSTIRRHARFSPRAGHRCDIDGAGRVNAIDEEGRLCRSNLRGGHTRGQTAQIKLQKCRVAIANVQVRHVPEVCSGTGGAYVRIGRNRQFGRAGRSEGHSSNGKGQRTQGNSKVLRHAQTPVRTATRPHGTNGNSRLTGRRTKVSFGTVEQDLCRADLFRKQLLLYPTECKGKYAPNGGVLHLARTSRIDPSCQSVDGKYTNMTKTGQTICLCMIVKNEHHVLRRCLESVRPHIDTWLIVDTGSTDGTQDLVRDFFRDLPGELIERPWKNFGHNRTESLALARGRADYILIMDADEYLIPESEFVIPGLTCDAYDVALDLNGITYYRNQLVRSALPWRYEGVLHEYITSDVPHTQCRLAGVKIHIVLEGARSSDPLKYRRDALVLEEALLAEPSNDRYMFYLAQSYRDAREPELAIQRYQRRIEMGGFPEEVWYSRFEIAKMKELKGDAWPEVLDAYLQSYAARPHRAEPLYRIGIAYQQRKEFQLARMFFGQALQVNYPANDFLFVETDMYQYLLPLEYAVACYWLGLHSEAIKVTDRLLANDSLAQDRREHLLRNRAYSVQALAGAAQAAGA